MKVVKFSWGSPKGGYYDGGFGWIIELDTVLAAVIQNRDVKALDWWIKPKTPKNYREIMHGVRQTNIPLEYMQHQLIGLIFRKKPIR